MEFILNEKTSDCILCQKPGETDDECNLILHRGRLNFVILNKFPYNPGHLMVAPYEHVASIEDVSEETAIEMMLLVRRAVRL